ncbi:outer membrane receptor protein involved in Fe transport [Mucilaginibacter gracilis]|uniref:Outer membrane receptor protein involved in Fe transport n=1 Tax=Mucilaginibacter gracilis TaxID=423350 RepID=A0A495IUS3_9SPHI|nr:outer membrane beta-barrel family protein [Mucilaginibacter gracilis]RKR80213.1 outer membrane receptor protein involved in Fe transport [Mucilaginibacter gracilis]
MKQFFTLIAILFITASVKAQIGGATGVVGRISGTVLDSATHKPLEFASVAIYRSGGKVPNNGVLTDEKGNFKLNEVKNGKWKIVISFPTYRTKTVDPVTTTPEKPDFNMGIINVAAVASTLNTVQITGTAAVIETKIDKIVFNAEKDITLQGGNATDVMRKVPLVSVDINGNVALRGDQNVKVLINGKPSGAMANNLADVLKSIPADQIKSVEVITSPSAKYDAEGSAGILNIVTKSKNVSGVSGSVSGGVGTRQNNGNANLNINQNRLSITGNFGGNFTWPQTSHTVSGTDFDATNYTHATSSSRISRYGYRGSGALSYDFNSYNSFNSNIALNQGGFKADGNSDAERSIDVPAKAATASTAAQPAVKSLIDYLSRSNSKTTFGGFDWNNDYIRKFKKEGHQIDIAGEWSHGITDFNSTSVYTTTTINDLRSVNNGVNNEYTLQADYTLPVNDKFKIEAGGKSIFRRLSSVYDSYTGSSTDLDVDPASFTYNSGLSNNYTYNQNIYSGYTVLTFTLPKSYALQVGSRLENTQIHGDPYSAVSGLTSFDNSYNVFIPTLALSKTIKNSTYKLTYTKRIQRPSLTFLNPYRNETNPTAITEGNPQLQPEISQYTELNYSTYIGASVINISAYYKYTSNLIEGIAVPFTNVSGSTSTSGTITTYQNIGHNNSFGASFFGSINPIKILTIRGSINAYTYNPNPQGGYIIDASQNGTYINYNAFLGQSVNLKGGWAAESFIILNSPKRTIQGTTPSFSLWIIGVKKEFWDKKASLGLNTFDPFWENKAFNTNLKGAGYTQFSNTQFPFRSFGISFSYAFGKVKFADQNDPTQKKKKGVNNDDLKQGDSSSGPGR